MSLKILVVDDDATTRRVLSRLLTSAFTAEVTEVENGLEALMAIEDSIPDLVLLDVSMPIMDGPATLKALRRSPFHRDLPVVSVSSESDRALVSQLINLGISDYLLKPLDLVAASKRLARVIQEIKTNPRSANGARSRDPGGRPGLLLVEPDPNFREMLRSLLDSKYVVEEASTGPLAFKIAQQRPPEILLLSEGLTLLNEHLFAQTIRGLPNPPRGIYLLHSGEVPPDEVDGFDGTIRKSFVPNTMLERFTKVVDQSVSAVGLLVQLIDNELRAELISAAQQTIGVMTQQEVEVGSDAQEAGPIREVLVGVDLTSLSGGLGASIGLSSSKADGESLSGRLLGAPTSWAEGANEAFGSLLETIGGRVRSSLDARGLKLEQQMVQDISAEPAESRSWRLTIPFQTAGGERFQVMMGVR